jgi:hypothetical protein
MTAISSEVGTSLLRGPEPEISEAEWSRILNRIATGQVVPVIGEHLTVMSSGTPPREMTLATYLAERLDLPGPPTASLDEIAFRYLQKKPHGLEDLYADIVEKLPTGDSVALPKPLMQLAEIRDFKFFLSTSFDPYMALALNEVRFGRRSSGSTRELAYEGSQSVDIPDRIDELDYPLVYHLFGMTNATTSFAVTDEDVLETMHSLQASERQPPHLMSVLRKKRLLVLGTRLTGWLTRFFLRISSADRLLLAQRADVIVDPAATADADQALFFEHVGAVKLLPMAPVRFIDELVRRWRARPHVTDGTTGPHPGGRLAGRGEVFLSYASEDRAVVTRLREQLEREAGVRVWLDKDELRGGDQWERHIADTLHDCAVCIPVVSASAKSGVYRFVRTEWEQAVRLQVGHRADQTFIIPLVIDDTRPDDPALSPEIRALHWRRLHDDEDMRRFIAEVRSAVEKARAI